jgi:hypothetical protein
MQLEAEVAQLDDQIMALTEERLELEHRRKKAENQRLKNDEERANIAARRKALFHRLSAGDAFELGMKIERSRMAKRRRLD